jgi:hypothetical protein
MPALMRHAHIGERQMAYKVEYLVDDEEHKQTMISTFYNVRGFRLANITYIPTAGPTRQPGDKNPRERPLHMQFAVLSAVQEQPGLCTRRLRNLERLAGFNQKELTKRITGERRSGNIRLSEGKKGQGGNFITPKGIAVLEKLNEHHDDTDYKPTAQPKRPEPKQPKSDKPRGYWTNAIREFFRKNSTGWYGTADVREGVPGIVSNTLQSTLQRLTTNKELIFNDDQTKWALNIPENVPVIKPENEDVPVN